MGASRLRLGQPFLRHKLIKEPHHFSQTPMKFTAILFLASIALTQVSAGSKSNKSAKESFVRLKPNALSAWVASMREGDPQTTLMEEDGAAED